MRWCLLLLVVLGPVLGLRLTNYKRGFDDFDFGNFYGFGNVKTHVLTKEVPVPYPVEVEKYEPYPVHVPVHRPVPIHIPRPYPVPIEKKIPIPIKVTVPEYFPVYKDVHIPFKIPFDNPIPFSVHKPVPIFLERKIHFPVEKEVHVPVKVPYEVPRPFHVPVEIEKPYAVYVPKAYPVPSIDKTVPYFNERNPFSEKFSDFRMPIAMPVLVHREEHITYRRKP